MARTAQAFDTRTARRGDARRMGQIHVDSWRETYASLLPAELLVNLSADREASRYVRTIETFRPGFAALVACDSSGLVAGFLTMGPSRHQAGYGEIYTLYVDPNHVGQGIGSALFRHAVREAAFDRAGGFDGIEIRVLKGNPATQFYRRMGAHKTGELAARFGNVPITEEIFLLVGSVAP